MNDRLRELEIVGSGAMAEVYRGVLMGERGTRRQVAIKRLRPELREDPVAIDLFVNEARIAVRLSHPNVVPALELARDESGYALVCEWLDCVSLAELSDNREIPAFALIHVGRCVCIALDYLHNLTDNDSGAPLGLVHRDVTPANVFVTKSGRVKLGDFGVAWCAGEPSSFVPSIAGTPHFAAPEQERGEAIDARADIYGLGATLRHVARDIPDELDTLITQACAAQREQRFSSARELLGALEALAAGVDWRTAEYRLSELVSGCGGTQVEPSTSRLDSAVQSILGDALNGSDPIPEPTLNPAPRRWPRLLAGGVLVVSLCALGLGIWDHAATPIHSNEPRAAKADETAAEPGRSTGSQGATGSVPNSVGVQTDELAATHSAQPAAEHISEHDSRISGSLRQASVSAGAEHPEAEQRAFRPGRAHRPTDEAPTEPVKLGTVHLNALPWAQVTVDGHPVGNTPVRALTLAAGRHTLSLVHPPQAIEREVRIEVDAGQVQTFLVDLRRGTVKKRVHDEP